MGSNGTQPVTVDVDQLAPAVAEAIKGDVIEQVMKRLDELPAIKTAGVISKNGGTADQETKTFADWLYAYWRRDYKRLNEVYETKMGGAWLDKDNIDTKSAPAVKAPLAEGSGVTGGVLVPPQFVAELLQVAAEDAIVRPRAYKQPMTTRTTQIPFLDQTTAPSAGNSAFLGGVVANWVAEAGALTETEPTFRMMELVAHKLAGYTLASTEQLEDSAIALEQLLKTLFGKAINWYEDYGFLRGNGVGKPLGVQNSPAAIAVSRAGGQNAFEVTDALAMRKRLPQASQKNAVWIMHPFTISDLYQLAVDKPNGGTTAVGTFVNWAMDLRGSPDDWKLLGLPIIFSEKMNTPGSAFDVALCDFSFYVIGDRRALEVASSEHFKFTNDQITWRFTYRVDGQPWLNNAIQLADTSTSTISPFIYLS